MLIFKLIAIAFPGLGLIIGLAALPSFPLPALGLLFSSAWILATTERLIAHIEELEHNAE